MARLTILNNFISSKLKEQKNLVKSFVTSEDKVLKGMEHKLNVINREYKRFDSEAFRQVTTAATLSDVAGWSMIAFQAAFYERVFSLTPQEYDPLLAMVIPIAGVTGGLGGGWICDRLQSRGPNGQRWFISIMTIAAGPLLAASLLADDYKTSLMYLFPGIVASEIFRAPTAVMTRDALPETPSVAAAAHLAVLRAERPRFNR